eukprot:2682130-Rhodomonas_salina.1
MSRGGISPQQDLAGLTITEEEGIKPLFSFVPQPDRGTPTQSKAQGTQLTSASRVDQEPLGVAGAGLDEGK